MNSFYMLLKIVFSGDILGKSMSNLGKLLKLPTGCGEQNMLYFAPDVFIMKYLTATGMLRIV